MKKLKVTVAIVVVLFIAFASVFNNPITALKIGALANGCEWKDVRKAEFEKQDSISTSCDVYMCVNNELEDNLTGSAHSTWYIHRVLFINIPEWAGNG